MIVYTSDREINTFIPNKKRIRVVGKDENGDFDLEISNASLCDQGFYTCSIDPVVGKQPHSKSYILQLKERPTNITINNETEERTIIGKENQKMKLVCNVESGLPPEKMLWKMNGLILKEGGPRINVYEFYPNRSLHHSNLTCEVMNNETEKPLTKSIRLDIKYKPEVLISRESLVPSYEGSKKKLCCEIDSNPNVIFMVWYKNPISQIKNNNSTCLVLENVTRQDSGNYTCFAGNEIGNGSSTSSLVVSYPPTVYVEYNNFFTSKNKSYVYCKADGIPNNITFYRLEHKSHFNEHIRYIEVTSDGIAELPYTTGSHRYQDTGLYICNASNGVSDGRGKLFQQGVVYLVYDALRTRETVKKNITINIHFHDVNITAYGIQLTFHLDRLHSFQGYNVTVCNNFSSSSFVVDVRQGAKNESKEKAISSEGIGIVVLLLLFVVLLVAMGIYVRK